MNSVADAAVSTRRTVAAAGVGTVVEVMADC